MRTYLYGIMGMGGMRHTHMRTVTSFDRTVVGMYHIRASACLRARRCDGRFARARGLGGRAVDVEEALLAGDEAHSAGVARDAMAEYNRWMSELDEAAQGQ